jgi:hypothetical protein
MATAPPKTSSNLTLSQVQQKFALDVAKQTGVDPRVILAQELAEGAYSSNGTKGFNFLNLRDSTVESLGKPYEASSSGGFAKFHDLAQAEDATIAEFKSAAIRDFVYPYATPRTQIAGLAKSPWDGGKDPNVGHYGGVGGPKLVADFLQITNDPASLDAPPIKYNPNTNSFTAENSEGVSAVGLNSLEGGLAVAGIALTGAPVAILSAGYEGTLAAGRLLPYGYEAAKEAGKLFRIGGKAAARGGKGAAGAAGASGVAAKLLKAGGTGIAIAWIFDNWERVFEVIGGMLLIVIGVAQIVQSQGGKVPTPIAQVNNGATIATNIATNRKKR